MDQFCLVYGIHVVPPYISPKVVAYGSSKTVSYSSDMSESLYVAEASPVIKVPSQASLTQA